MAPSEFDLRAALRDGEGEGLNADRLMMIGEAYSDRRRQHRVRLLSAATVVAVISGVAVAAVQFGGNGESGAGGGSMADKAIGGAAGGGQLRRAQGSATGVAGVPMASSAHKALAGVACPSPAPHYSLSRGNGSAPYGATSPLFTSAVTSLVVCAYGPSFDAASARQPARLEVAGSLAARLAVSLENAPAAAPDETCSSVTTQEYAVIPVDTSGDVLQPVTAQLPATACGAMVTNGTAVRYGWQPPPKVARKLHELTAAKPPDSPVAASPTATN
jgi:hypothetical protein